MSIINFALLLNALAHFVTALAKFVGACRRHK
jgi:hypothetical protein